MSKETRKKWWHPLMPNRLKWVWSPGILAKIRRAKDRRDYAAFIRKQWETAGDPRTRENRAREARMERMGVDLAKEPDSHVEGFWIEESHDVDADSFIPLPNRCPVEIVSGSKGK